MERINRLITIDLDINEKLKKYAKEDKRSVNSLIELCLSEYVKLFEEKLTMFELMNQHVKPEPTINTSSNESK